MLLSLRFLKIYNFLAYLQCLHSYKTIKTMCYNAPEVLHTLLSHLAEQTAAYVRFQIDSGAQCMQVSSVVAAAGLILHACCAMPMRVAAELRQLWLINGRGTA